MFILSILRAAFQKFLMSAVIVYYLYSYGNKWAGLCHQEDAQLAKQATLVATEEGSSSPTGEFSHSLFGKPVKLDFPNYTD